MWWTSQVKFLGMAHVCCSLAVLGAFSLVFPAISPYAVLSPATLTLNVAVSVLARRPVSSAWDVFLGDLTLTYLPSRNPFHSSPFPVSLPHLRIYLPLCCLELQWDSLPTPLLLHAVQLLAVALSLCVRLCVPSGPGWILLFLGLERSWPLLVR